MSSSCSTRSAFVLLALFSIGPIESATAAPENPPPANKLEGYASYELGITQMTPEIGKKKNADKVLERVQSNMQKHVQPVVDEWNAKAGSTGKGKLLLEPNIVSLHKPSGANRFFAGALAGQSRIMIKVKIIEQESGKLIAEPEFYQHANAMGAAWSIGATDNAMLERVTELVAGYMQRNYLTPTGGATGYED